MVAKSVPYRCIWCLKEPPNAAFRTESHILPKSIGNIKQQVLPPGVVCDGCNHFFGRDLEPNLIDEPVLSTLAAILQLRDIDSKFVYMHSPSGTHRNAHMKTAVSANKITQTTQYEIKGQIDKPNEVKTISKSKCYDKRALAFLSRAVHKMAFETLAHNLFVSTGLKYQNKELGDMDIFDPNFNVIREWVRDGKPQHSVRPALRIQKFDEVERQQQLFEWGGKCSYFPQWICYELNLFSDWYVLSLTSPADRVKGDLINWLKKRKPNHQVIMVGDALEFMDKSLWG